METLLSMSRVIDAVNTKIGKSAAWLILVAVLVSSLNAVVRKVFGISSNAWLELQWVLFSVVFLLCAPWTLLVNEHIRIDIVSNMFPKSVRNGIELMGHGLFLLPLCVLMIVTSGPFLMRSLEINEQSANAGGLPQWPAKALVLIGFVLLLAQAISELVKRIAVIRGLIPDPHVSGGHTAAAEAEAARLLQAIDVDAISKRSGRG